MQYAVSNGAYSRGLPREVETSGQAIGWVWRSLRKGELVSPNIAGVPFALLHDVSIPSRRGSPSDFSKPPLRYPARSVSIPSRRGSPSD